MKWDQVFVRHDNIWQTIADTYLATLLCGISELHELFIRPSLKNISHSVSSDLDPALRWLQYICRTWNFPCYFCILWHGSGTKCRNNMENSKLCWFAVVCYFPVFTASCATLYGGFHTKCKLDLLFYFKIQIHFSFQNNFSFKIHIKNTSSGHSWTSNKTNLTPQSYCTSTQVLHTLATNLSLFVMYFLKNDRKLHPP